jgi:hypothetical protein
MALEAIYGDDLVKFEYKAGLRYFQVSCFVHGCYHLFLDGGNLGISVSSLPLCYYRFTYVTIFTMALRCALSYLQLLKKQNMEDVLLVIQKNMMLDQMNSPTLATLSTCLL